MTLEMENKKRSRGTNCRIDCPARVAKLRDGDKARKKNRRNVKKYRKQRQYLVYKPEVEVWHEPYMETLKNEFPTISPRCDSNIELPWQDIAVIVKDTRTDDGANCEDYEAPRNEHFSQLETAEFTDRMELPWRDLVIEEILSNVKERKINGIVTCDSSLEIPWNQLIIEGPLRIEASPEVETCPHEDFEVPWDAILVPKNIVIEPRTQKKHPSSNVPARKSKRRNKNQNCFADCSDKK